MTINNSPVVVFSLSLPSFYLEWLCSDQNGKHGLVHAMLNWFSSYFFGSVSSLIFDIKIKQYTSQVGDCKNTTNIHNQLTAFDFQIAKILTGEYFGIQLFWFFTTFFQ